MGAKTKRRKAPSPIEQLDGPTEAQIANGDFHRDMVPHPDGGNRVAMVHINRGGTPLTRWCNPSDPRLTDVQMTAIRTCLRLWEMVGIRQRTTANYGERIPGGGNEECRAASYLEAKDDLRRIEGYFDGLDTYWTVFENVCRWDEPAGVAGSRLGFSTRSAETRAHQIVCFVADIIASKEGLAPAARIRAA